MQQTRRFMKPRTTAGRCKSGMRYAQCRDDPDDSIQGVRYFVESSFKRKDHNMKQVCWQEISDISVLERGF